MGIISICQPDTEKSCGACCGLYNWEDYSRETVSEILRSRTDLFQHYFSKREVDKLALYQTEMKNRLHPLKMYDDIFNCEFLGFINQNRGRVGCLLHPMVNDGYDYRDYAFYGKELCFGHECPSNTYLNAEEKFLVTHVLGDWYLYGLVVTDIDLVKDYYKNIRIHLGGPLKPQIMKDPQLTVIASDFFSLKENWKFRKEARFGKYTFSYGEYRLARMDYEGLGTRKSKYHSILLSLGSSFESGDDLVEAEEILEGHIWRFVERYRELDPLWHRLS